jgi:hypothetical protein
MESKRARIVGLILVLLPLVYFAWYNLETYLPRGNWPYTPLEEWAMGVGEVAIIFGIALSVASHGRWRLLGVSMVGAPVVYVGATQIVYQALPNWGSLGVAQQGIMVAGAALVALGLFLQVGRIPSVFRSRSRRGDSGAGSQREAKRPSPDKQSPDGDD